MAKVLLAMSGGVDSSVAAALLQRDGHEVVGCFMRLGSPGEELEGLVDPATVACRREGGGLALPTLRIGHRGCCSIEDAGDARTVAGRLGIPFYVCNFKKDFGRIVDYFAGEYAAGRTPNPCVRCNDWLKFGKLREYARALGCELVASGHYAQAVAGPEGPELLRGRDAAKDQSYVLFGIRRDDLAATRFPIGGLEKPAVRELARELGLPVSEKPDSQDICFVPDDDYAGLLERRTPGSVRPGRIKSTDGRDLGEHPGHQHFTIGQRKGLGVAADRPLYVVAKDPATNEVTIGDRKDLERDGFTAADANWLVEPPADWLACRVQWRAHGEAVPSRVRATGPATFELRLDEPREAVAAGQAAVLYDAATGERVLGGGWIA
jgi:tRNA-specific 2-thiouridylase